jgi:hypothetical protein
MATTAKTKTKTKPATPDDEWSECAGCFRERRLTAEGVLVAHRAWYGMRIGMQPCPGAGLAAGEKVT